MGADHRTPPVCFEEEVSLTHWKSAKWAHERLGSHSQSAFYELCRKGQVPCTKLGRTFLFDEETFEAWLADLVADAAERPGGDRDAEGV